MPFQLLVDNISRMLITNKITKIKKTRFIVMIELTTIYSPQTFRLHMLFSDL